MAIKFAKLRAFNLVKDRYNLDIDVQSKCNVFILYVKL